MAQNVENQISAEQIRRSTLFGFLAETILTPYISPVETRSETQGVIGIVNDSTRWSTGELISTEDRENVAAMHVLQGAANCIAVRTRLAVPKPLVKGAEAVYHSAQQPFEDLDLDFGINFDGLVFRDTFRACRRSTPAPTPASRIVQEVWQKRGTITQEYFNTVECGLALMMQDESGVTTDPLKSITVGPDGEIIPGYALPETPTISREIPFYAQYISETHGAKPYLAAFLEDITAIDGRLRML